MAKTLKTIEKQKINEDWLWDGVIKRNSINIFAGQQSRGKSMLVSELIKSGMKKQRGQEYLGYGVHQFKTLYISTEMNEQKIKGRFSDLGVDGRMKSAEKNLFIYYNPVPTLLDIEREINECSPDLIVIDVLVGLVNAEKLNIDSYSDINALAAQLKKFDKTFILIHHMNKSNQVLGSTGLTSAMDTRMEMRETSVDEEDGVIITNQTIEIYGKSVSKRFVDVVFKYPHFTLKEASDDVDELDKPVSKLMQYVITKRTDKQDPKLVISGYYQEVAAECQLIEKCGFNPKRFGLLLKMNADVLRNNNIFFETKRKTGGYHVRIWYDPDYAEADEAAATTEENLIDIAEATLEDDEYEQ